MIDRLRFGPKAARLWSGELTDLDWERLQGQLGSEANIARALDERRAAKRSGWERFAPMLDAGTMIALGGYNGNENSVEDLFNLNRRSNRSPFFTGSRGGSDFNNPLALNFESDVGKTFGERYIP